MKKTLMCATAAAALVSVGTVANAQDHNDEGWYTRADVGYTFAGNLDHDPEPGVIGSLAGDSNVSDLLGGWLGAGYDFGNNFRFEVTGGYRAGDLNSSLEFNGIPTVSDGSTVILNDDDGDVQVWDAMANLLYDFGTDSRVEPCLLYTSPSPRDQRGSRMPSSA